MEIITGKTYYKAPDIYYLRDLILQAQEKFRERIFVSYRVKPSDKELIEKTYEDFYHDVVRMQQALLTISEPGSRVAVIGDNSYRWMVTYMAVASGFGTIVPIDRLLKHEEIGLMLKRCDANIVVYDAPFHDLMQSIQAENDQIQHLILKESNRLTDEKRRKIEEEKSADEKFFFFDDFLQLSDCEQEFATKIPDEMLLDQHDDDETAAILFTSGTSAEAKAVMLTESNLCANVRSLLGSVYFGEHVRALSILPLHHTFENTCGFLSMQGIGARVDICDGLRYVAKNLKEHHSYIVIAVPALLESIKRTIEKQAKRSGKERKLKFALRLSRFLNKIGIDRRREIFKDVLAELGGELQVFISGAASLDKETLRFYDALGIDVLQGYGLTEASPVVAGGNTKVNVIGTIGQPISGVTVAIDNEKDGEVGEILVYADSVMKGYLDNGAATREAIDEAGWLHTGDIGRIGRRDTLSITGRSKSMIVLSSGKKVFPEELEELLLKNEYIKDSLVFGQETDTGDVVITAKLVLDEDKIKEHSTNADKAVSEEEIRAQLAELIDEINSNLPHFKGIRSYFYSFQDMIKTTTMKVRRGLEMERLEKLFQESKANWHSLRGENIDEFIKNLSKEKSEAKGSKVQIDPEIPRELSKSERDKKRETKRVRRRLERDLRVINRLQDDLREQRNVLQKNERELQIRQAVLEQRIHKLKNKAELEELNMENFDDLMKDIRVNLTRN